MVSSGFIFGGGLNRGTVHLASDAMVDVSLYTWKSYHPVAGVGTIIIDSEAKWTSDETTYI